MADYKRPQPSIDAKIKEIPTGTYRIKITGSIVNITTTSVVVNDGTGQVTLHLDRYSMDEFEVGQFGRFVAELSKSDDKVYGNLIAWTSMTQEQVKKYWKLVQIERRVPE